MSETEIAQLTWVKPTIAIGCLAVLWSWETLFPYFHRERRMRHAGANLAIAIVNTLVLTLLFGTVVVAVAGWSERNGWGLLNQLRWPLWGEALIAVVLLDLWLYWWHRANHRISFLWRFHRMHHADHEMDVTTATRFHLGEHTGAAILRTALIPIIGWQMGQLLIYETLVVAITMFHHANISVGRWDAPLRALIVTPYFHKVHHSRVPSETDSNYATLFSFWDRLFGSFRMRENCQSLSLGLVDFDDPRWQSFWGMLKTPFAGRDWKDPAHPKQETVSD